MGALATRLITALPPKVRHALLAIPYRVLILRRLHGTVEKECPICGYVGKFGALGHPPRYNVICKRCGSVGRHRLVYLAMERVGFISKDDRIVHFAPEPIISKLLAGHRGYETADLQPGRADRVLNMEKLDLADGEVDVFLANHVLEHVDDRKAFSELFRTLRPGGKLVLTVPIVEGMAQTYEEPSIISKADRQEHFGRFDHVRLYGRDFRARITSAGFKLTEFNLGAAEAIRFSVNPGETVFIATKPL